MTARDDGGPGTDRIHIPLRPAISTLEGMSRWYSLLYGLGIRPWEEDTEPQLEQLRGLLERVERGRDPAGAKALDLGCGTGRFTVELARRGWDVVGVDIVPTAVELAQQRVHAAGVPASVVLGDVTRLERAGVGDDHRLVLDAECFNHLDDDQRMAVGRGVDAVAGPDAEMLVLVWRRAYRGPLPRGASRDDLLRSFRGWTIVDEFAYEAPLPLPLRRIEPTWYLLARA